ncbi:unnamed protein product [Mytilus edulis]|uniref:TLDc domain-containing protein n=1 Tax=Mytilus edulis TaxID=6550 RepID=A0A8S3VAJ6_MYTED|nr:unnamed protein product [Mytilus edulis]
MSKQLSEQDTDKLNKWIKGGKRKKYTQLYSAASDGCDPSTFHTKCDNKGPTVTLVHNVNGSVYGGYSSVSWLSGSGESVYDANAFLFLLTGGNKKKPCKFNIKTPEYALTMDEDCGPSFGKGPDLLTFQDAVSKSTDFFHLNSVMVPDSYTISEKTIKEIAGEVFDAEDVVIYAVEGIYLTT